MMGTNISSNSYSKSKYNLGESIMRYLLTILLLLGFSFGQKTVEIKKQVADEKKIEVKAEVKDGKVLYKITEDGKTEEFEADMNDEEAMAKIHAMLEKHDIDGDTKVIIHKNIKGHECTKETSEKEYCDQIKKIKVIKKVQAHDCKKENCDPANCEYAVKAACKKDDMVWHMKGDDSEKMIKVIQKQKMMDEKAGYLGIQIQDLSAQLGDHFKVKDGKGVLVSEVVDDSPAKKAGLKAGDIITKVNDKEIANAADLTSTIRSYEPDTKVTVNILRDGKKKNIDATLGKADNSFLYKFGDLGEIGEKHKMMLKIHPESSDEFEFHGFPFDKEEFKAEMDELREELKKMKEELKQLQDKK